MKKINPKLKAGVFAVTMLFLFMATALTITAETQHPYTYRISPFNLGETITTGPAADPSQGDEPYPPSDPRCSFMFLTGVYGDYNGQQKLIGIRINVFYNTRGGTHTVNWSGGVHMTMEGDHEGEYYFPNWFWTMTFWGPAGWTSLSYPYIWDPVHDRIVYAHFQVDYKEDGQHIRYVDRTFTETWTGIYG